MTEANIRARQSANVQWENLDSAESCGDMKLSKKLVGREINHQLLLKNKLLE